MKMEGSPKSALFDWNHVIQEIYQDRTYYLFLEVTFQQLGFDKIDNEVYIRAFFICVRLRHQILISYVRYLITMSLYDNPIKKGDKFICPSKQKIVIKLKNVRVLNIVSLSSERSVMEIAIENKEDIERLNQFDLASKDAMLRNNPKWFKNNLTSEKIIERFNPSFDIQTGILRIYIFASHLPNITLVEMVEGSMFNNSNVIDIEVRLMGLYILSDSFGIRWIVKSIDIITLNDSLVDNERDIQRCYSEEIKELEDIIDMRVDALLSKKQELRNMLVKCQKKEANWEDIRKYVNSFLSNIVINK